MLSETKKKNYCGNIKKKKRVDHIKSETQKDKRIVTVVPNSQPKHSIPKVPFTKVPDG